MTTGDIEGKKRIVNKKGVKCKQDICEFSSDHLESVKNYLTCHLEFNLFLWILWVEDEKKSSEEK